MVFSAAWRSRAGLSPAQSIFHGKGSKDHWSTPAFGATGERLEFLRDFYCFNEGRAGQREVLKTVHFSQTENVSHAEVFISGFNMWYTREGHDHEVMQSWVDTWVEGDPYPCPEEFGPDNKRWCVNVKLKYVMKDEDTGNNDDFNKACIGFTIVALTKQAILLSDNFSDGKPDGWEFIYKDWSVGKDDRNYCLHGHGHAHARPTNGEKENWTDYTLEARIKLIKGGIHLEYLIDAQGRRYFIGFRKDEIYLAKESPKGELKNLTKVQRGLTLGQWHVIQIKSKGGKIEVYVDSKKQQLPDYIDSSPLKNGRIGFEVLPDSEACVDDVEVVPSSYK